MPKKIYGTPNDDVIKGPQFEDVVIYGGDGDDDLKGYGHNNALYGEDGDDTLSGSIGVDILIAGDGHDKLYGNFGADWLSGDSGNDVLNGGEGGDYLFGGAGSDTASYLNTSPIKGSAGVSVSLLTGYAAGNDAEGDQLDSIENLIGSNFDDNLSGDNNNNDIDGQGGHDALFGFGGDDHLLDDYGDDDLYGGDGNDELDGGRGYDDLYGGDDIDVLDGGLHDDRLYGQAGDDWLAGGHGADVINGGSGIDTAAYSESSAAVTIDLSVAFANGGHATGDTLSGIENVRGSDFGDTLSGDGGANTLAGGMGTDVLKGNGDADIFYFSSGTMELGRDADRIMDFNQAEGDRIKVTSHLQDIAFIGDDGFSGQAGELRYEQTGTNTWVNVDMDGDAQADGQVLCTGIINFSANDFLL
jgi:Ca2+-binding RTX toxin-like protein